MGLYQRRRPAPIKIYPNPARRQEEEYEEPDSGSSVGTTPGPDSASSAGSEEPDSPTTLGPDEPATLASTVPTAAPTQLDSGSLALAVTNGASSSLSAPPRPAPLTTTTTRLASSTASTSGPAITNRPLSGAGAQAGENLSVNGEEPDSPDSPDFPSPTSSSQPTSSTNDSSGSSTTSGPAATDSGLPESQLAGESTGIAMDPPHSPGHRTMGKGAEAALITSAVLGFVALFVGAYFLYKRRKRRGEAGARHAESGTVPNNDRDHSGAETVQIAFDPGHNHVTRSTNNSDTLFGGSYQRPETVSTNTNSRAPLPTPNPFADPPRNKAFDQLRGRPRSTTLTDRGSWVKNPFRDPESDRFDPFGELQEKARLERMRYLQEVRQENMDRREREREQQVLEKERMGLEVPEPARKGTGGKVDGLGILELNNNGQYL